MRWLFGEGAMSNTPQSTPTAQFTAEDILWCREFGFTEGIALAKDALTDARDFITMFNGDTSKIDAVLRRVA